MSPPVYLCMYLSVCSPSTSLVLLHLPAFFPLNKMPSSLCRLTHHTELLIKASGDKVVVRPWVEVDRGDAIDVGEDMEAVRPGDMPETDRFINRGGQEEVVLVPREVNHIRGMTCMKIHGRGTRGRTEFGKKGRIGGNEVRGFKLSFGSHS